MFVSSARSRSKCALTGIAALLATLLAVPSLAHAVEAKLRFRPSPDADVIGYRLYVASSSNQVASAAARALTGILPGPNGTFEAMIDLAPGTSYVGLKAWDGKFESALSNVIAITPTNTPPIAGASYWQDFGGLESGVTPPGFWVFDQGGDPITSGPGSFRIAYVSGDPVLADYRVQPLRAVYVSGALQAWAGYEFRGRMRHDGVAGSVSASVMTDVSGEGGYSLVMVTTAQGGTASLSSPEGRCQGDLLLDTKPKPGIWYEFVLRSEPVGPSTQVRAKLWTAGSLEPSGWSANCKDDSLEAPRTGTIGVERGNTPGSGFAYWDDFVVVPLFEQTCVEGRACDDGKPATVGDLCRGGICGGSPCFTNQDCGDGVLCNGAERCVTGVCQAASAPVLCSYASVELDGSGYLASSAPASLGFSNAFTISLWLRPLELPTSVQTLIAIGDPAAPVHSVTLSLWSTRGDLLLIQAGQTNTKRYQYPAAIDPDRWQHVAVTWNGTQLRAFVDGGELSPTKLDDPTVYMLNTPRKVSLGATLTSGSRLVGRLGHVALWNRALSSAERSVVLNGLHDIDLRTGPTGLLHYWRLGEDLGAIGRDVGPAPVNLQPIGIDASNVVVDAP